MPFIFNSIIAIKMMVYLLSNSTRLTLTTFYSFALPCVSGLTDFSHNIHPLLYLFMLSHDHFLTSYVSYFKVSHAGYLPIQLNGMYFYFCEILSPFVFHLLLGGVRCTILYFPIKGGIILS